MWRVLLGPTEVAGQASLSAEALRLQGISARVASPEHRFGYDPGPDIYPAAGWDEPGLRGKAVRSAYAFRLAPEIARSNLLHFHFGATFVTYYYPSLPPLDAILAKRLGKKIISQFHGSEVRSPSTECARNPYYIPFLGESDQQSLATLARWAELSEGTCIISDVGLEAHVRSHFSNVHYVPLATNTFRKADAIETPPAAVPRVVHAPSELSGKGTAQVRTAVASLKSSGLRFTYVELANHLHSEVTSSIQQADIVIDQLRGGTYGRVSVEGMAAGKSTLAYIQDSLVSCFPPDLPIINVNPESLEDSLRRLLSDPELRAATGEKSLAYAKREHSVSALGRALSRAYSLVDPSYGT